jgi:hypothetical protein
MVTADVGDIVHYPGGVTIAPHRHEGRFTRRPLGDAVMEHALPSLDCVQQEAVPVLVA